MKLASMQATMFLLGIHLGNATCLYRKYVFIIPHLFKSLIVAHVLLEESPAKLLFPFLFLFFHAYPH